MARGLDEEEVSTEKKERLRDMGLWKRERERGEGEGKKRELTRYLRMEKGSANCIMDESE